ncbi:MAG TPA: universal stress protein [Blastocatellia bacterium]|nr:universal stress protein [Blastocatellia bacterium]
MKVMISYDGSHCADEALNDLHRAGLPSEAEALVISVAERWLPWPSVTVQAGEGSSGTAAVRAPEMTDDIKKAYALASEAKLRLQSYFASWKLEVVVASGSPAREILRVANEWKPDLIVLGCQGRSNIGRFLLGSVSQKVLNEAPCSVRVCRGTAWKSAAPVRIVIGLDGSRSSEEAVRVVAGRVWPIGSEVRLIAVYDPSAPERNAAAGQDSKSYNSEWIQEFVSAAEKSLRAVDLNVSQKVEGGNPKSVLVASAGEWGADCIVIGAAGSASTLSALGDVATAVVARAHCSVEVIRLRPSR